VTVKSEALVPLRFRGAPPTSKSCSCALSDASRTLPKSVDARIRVHRTGTRRRVVVLVAELPGGGYCPKRPGVSASMARRWWHRRGLLTLALCSDGTVAAWGQNGCGQLGDNTTANRRIPCVGKYGLPGSWGARWQDGGGHRPR